MDLPDPGIELGLLHCRPTELSGKTHDYTVEVTNRFKGIDLVDKVLEELWVEVCNTVQEVVIKTIPKKRNAKRQNGCLRRP